MCEKAELFVLSFGNVKCVKFFIWLVSTRDIEELIRIKSIQKYINTAGALL